MPLESSFSPSYAGVLTLNDLRLKVNLGVPDAERDTPQDVSFSFRFYFKELPDTCNTDDIKGSICYHDVAKVIEQRCKNKEFRTLEYLGHFLYTALRNDLARDILIRLNVTKCNTPVEHLHGCASFECGDTISSI